MFDFLKNCFYRKMSKNYHRNTKYNYFHCEKNINIFLIMFFRVRQKIKNFEKMENDFSTIKYLFNKSIV